MKIIDKYWYPVACFKNRPITNLIRKIIHGSIYKTINCRNDWIDMGNGAVRHIDDFNDKSVTCCEQLK